MNEQAPSKDVSTQVETYWHIAEQLRAIADNIETHQFPDSAELLRRYASILDDASAPEPPAGLHDGPDVIPRAWFRVHHTPDSVNGPSEPDIDMAWGDQPEGDRWQPLYLRPAPPPVPEWQPMDTAPRDGSAFLAYGIHDANNLRSWRVGDNWRAIVLFDVYREVGMGGSEFVFSKDGARLWSKPAGWMPLPELPTLTKESAP